jgi:ketosteroid isomerase-like protein
VNLPTVFSANSLMQGRAQALFRVLRDFRGKRSFLLSQPQLVRLRAEFRDHLGASKLSRHISIVGIVLWSALVVGAGASQTATASTAHEIDRDIWSVFVATVAADDIVGMGRAYFPDAVLVSPKGTRPIKDTLEGWGRDMVAAKARGDKATVAFRFSRRQDDGTTAFEAGIFKYTVIAKSGASTPKFYPFEELLVKTNGKWRVPMERQFAEVTQDAWDQLPK